MQGDFFSVSSDSAQKATELAQHRLRLFLVLF